MRRRATHEDVHLFEHSVRSYELVRESHSVRLHWVSETVCV